MLEEKTYSHSSFMCTILLSDPGLISVLIPDRHAINLKKLYNQAAVCEIQKFFENFGNYPIKVSLPEAFSTFVQC